MQTYGYIRVSAKDQNLDRQLIAMKEASVEQKNLYIDKMSGKDFVRPQYIKLLRKLKKGDRVIVKSIDRLGRDYSEILEQWRKITREIEADIQVIDMPLLNTRQEKSDLTGVFIADLVLQILAYVAETERAFIKQRQAEGIAAAKLRGVKFGCRKKEIPDEFLKYYNLWKKGEISIRNGAKELSMNYSTFYRRCLDMQKMEESCHKM